MGSEVAPNDEREVVLDIDGLSLPGLLRIPAPASGVVVFAHGSGSSRLSSRNRFVAGVLADGGFATLLLDLLTEAEAGSRPTVFDIQLLARRLRGALDWIGSQHGLAGLPVGLFGASTGAAAALWVAADAPDRVRAVVSRGGRADMATVRLQDLQAPTLLIIGGADALVLGMTRDVLPEFGATAELEVIPGAGHLFEEPGALERVAELARDWFARHLADSP